MKKIVCFLVAAMTLMTGCGTADDVSEASSDSTESSAIDTTETTTIVSGETASTTTTTKANQQNTSASNKASSTKATTTKEYIFTTKTTFKRVTPARSAAETAKLINNNIKGSITKIKSEVSTVWYPKSSSEWTYSHHASIAVFKGKTYVMFSNGKVNEDDCGQRIMISSSSDFKNWSTPVPVLHGDTAMGEFSQLVKLAGRLYTHNGKMYATFSESEYKPEDLRGTNIRPQTDEPRINYKHYIISTTDGKNWKLEASGNGGYGLNGQPLQSGRYILPGNQNSRYTDDPTGISSSNVGAMNLGNIDTVMKEYGIKLICEGSYYQTADGIVRNMWRTDSDYILMAESYNNGETWTRPYMTKFKNGYSKFKFGYLPDGRYFCIYNPTGYNRLPLSIAISEDGINFDKQYTIRDEQKAQQFQGLWKGGVYAYPEFDIVDGYLYIAYSVQKEGMEVTRIKLSDIK